MPNPGDTGPKTFPAEATPVRLPRALTDHTGYLAIRLGYESQRLFQDAIESFGLRPTAYDYLATLAEFGPLSQKDVARVLGIDAARVVAMTDEMERRNAVERSVDPLDRRRNLLSLTPKGTKLLKQVADKARDVERTLLEPLNANERKLIGDLLRRALRYS